MAYPSIWIKLFLLVTAVASILIVLYMINQNKSNNDNIVLDEDFVEFRYFNNSLPSSQFLVPNLVHFVRFGSSPVSFIDAVCILAASKNQNPDVILVHTDQPNFIGGPYWDVVTSEIGDKIRTVYRDKPTTVFGKELSSVWRDFHAGDVARLQILMEYGGIFLDNDSYIVKSLDEFRRFEMTLGWQDGGNLSNQVIIAHRSARFLKLWLDSYRDYRADEWFYNAGEKPTQDILMKRPYLIHRVKRYLAEWIGTPTMIYLEKSDAWRCHFAIHLLIRHTYILGRNLTEKATYPVTFDERNILDYDVNIKSMALDVYPFNKTVI